MSIYNFVNSKNLEYYKNRFSATKWKFLDKVRLWKGDVKLEYDSKYLVDSIIGGLKSVTERQSVAKYIGLLLLDTVKPYVPTDTGKLAEKGMLLHTTNKYAHAEIDLHVRNTKAVPYALYQYYGKVWGPNYATWEMRKFDWNNLKMSNSPATHVGWVSPKGKGSKHPTNRDIGNAHTVTLKDGRQIVIKGYTNPNSQPRWIEYVRNTPSVWVPFTQEVTKAVRAKWGESVKASDREKLWDIRMRYVARVTRSKGHISD